ncbi:cytoplasmic protein [Auriscalpium vulgare]|uniref:Cytoplasmic protein n=1 Tax=Auriscalpium vulgare TaxID=40419 RepID=A0ACB8S3P0_9AGAM|nr:cytoplasmic protein [Auriscalpium vulgare]
MSRAAASSTKALAAILPLIASGQAYEAHQKARTFASRYVKSEQYDTAVEVLFQSARELLKAGQIGSGADLSSFLLDVYERKGEPVGPESRGRLTQLIVLIGANGSWRKTLIDKSIGWSAKHGPYPAGDIDLHHYIGELLYHDGALDAAEPHLLAAGKRDSARLLARVYFDWASATAGGLASYSGTYALRGALPYLFNGNVLAARAFMSEFLSLLPQIPPFRSDRQQPLAISADDEIVWTEVRELNFLQLAIRVIQRAQGTGSKAAREAWVRLCGTYQSRGGVLAQPEVRVVLNELATLYFAIPPPRTQNANPLGDIMSSLFGGSPGDGAAPPPRRSITPGSGRLGLD